MCTVVNAKLVHAVCAQQRHRTVLMTSHMSNAGHPPSPRDARTTNLLDERGQDDPPPWVLLLAILAVEELSQARVLLNGPLDHLQRPRTHEKHAHDGLGTDVEAEPAVDLKGVVGAGHKVEGEPARNEVALTALAQVGEDHMAVVVARLHQHRDSKRHLHPRLVGGGIVRMVDEVGHHGCKAPVVARVAEQVHDRHSSVTEVVHREGFEQALGVVESVVVQRDSLCKYRGKVLAVYLLAQTIKQRVDHHRPKVLPEEHRLVAYLRAKILQGDS
mmetsp:Transcript_35644/g.77801  ORF Transcript_35644/g.77801 Transcript_35644/m.77801 type:complete len:273 (-) Transcript_35644:288-1106(-)